MTPIYNHTVPFTRNKELKTILQTDNLEEFKKLTETDLLSDFKRLNCPCKQSTILTCILSYNQNNIAQHMLKTYPPHICDMALVMKRRANASTDYIFTMFAKMFTHPQMAIDKESIQQLVNIATTKKLWVIVDYLHHYGYTAYDVSMFFKRLSDSQINYYKQFYNNTNTDNNKSGADSEPKKKDTYILTLLNNKNVSLNTIENEITSNNISTTFITEKEHRTRLANIASFRNVEYITFLSKHKYPIDISLLNAACRGTNFPVIEHLMTQHHLTLTKDSMSTLLLCSKKQPTPRTGRRRRRRIMRLHGRRRVMGRFARSNLATSSANSHGDTYNDSVIKLVDIFLTSPTNRKAKKTKKTKDNQHSHNPQPQQAPQTPQPPHPPQPQINKKNLKILDSLLPFLIQNQLNLKNFKLLKHLQKNLNINPKKITIDCALSQYIKEDDIQSIKELFNLKLLRPIDVSTESSHLDYAFRMHAFKVANYFHNELHMKCTPNVTRSIHFHRASKNNNPTTMLETVKLLDSFGFVFDNTTLNLFCQLGSQEGVDYLISKGHKITPSSLELCIAYSKIKLFKYLLSKNYTYNKKNLLDRVLTIMSKKYIFRRKTASLRIVNTVLKLKGTATNASIKILLQQGKIKEAQLVYQQFNITPDLPSITHTLLNSYSTNDKDLLHLLTTLNTTHGIDIRALEPSLLNSIIARQLLLHAIEVVEFLTEKGTYTFTSGDFYTIMNHYYGDMANAPVNTFKYIESKGVPVTKDIFIKSISDYCTSLTKYMATKYNFQCTLKEVHNFIAGDHAGVRTIDTLFKYCTSSATPYTLYLTSLHCHNRWDCDLLQNVLSRVNSVTQETLDHIATLKDAKYDRMFRGVPVVEYVPTEDEITDFNIALLNDHDHDQKLSVDKSYVEHVLDDLKQEIKESERVDVRKALEKELDGEELDVEELDVDKLDEDAAKNEEDDENYEFDPVEPMVAPRHARNRVGRKIRGLHARNI